MTTLPRIVSVNYPGNIIRRYIGRLNTGAWEVNDWSSITPETIEALRNHTMYPLYALEAEPPRAA